MALYGIYGRHEIATCPLNNIDSARIVIQAVDTDLSKVLPKYKINKVMGQYHSGLEHTFLRIVDAEDLHLIEQFAVDSKTASFNEIKIIPLKTFQNVAEWAKKTHNL